MDSVQAICTGSCTRSRRTHAWMDLVTDPIWLTSSRRQLHARSSAARAMQFGSVAVRSLPTTWMSTCVKNHFQPSLSSWSKGSSTDTTVGKQPPGCTSVHQYGPVTWGGGRGTATTLRPWAQPCISYQSPQLPSQCLTVTPPVHSSSSQCPAVPHSPSQRHSPASQCLPSASQFHQSPSWCPLGFIPVLTRVVLDEALVELPQLLSGDEELGIQGGI